MDNRNLRKNKLNKYAKAANDRLTLLMNLVCPNLLSAKSNGDYGGLISSRALAARFYITLNEMGVVE